MRYFDFEHAAQEANVPPDRLQARVEHFRREYPNDEMMMDLRLLRACEAARLLSLGWKTVDETLNNDCRHPVKT